MVTTHKNGWWMFGDDFFTNSMEIHHRSNDFSRNPTDCPQPAPHRATLRQARRVVDLRHALLAAALAQHDARGAEVRQNVALRFHHLWISRGDHPKFWKNVDLYIYCNWRTKTRKIGSLKKKGKHQSYGD